MGGSPEENWHATASPRALLRLSRVRPSGRKYALLACAAVRHLVPGPRTELGARVLAAVERFAAAQPARGVTAHLWREVVRKELPEVPDPIPFDWDVGPDSGWAVPFAYRLGPLSQVHTADVNVIFQLALDPVRAAAAGEAFRDAQSLAARLVLGAEPAPAGWFVNLLRQVMPPKPDARAAAAAYRDAVLRRLPDGPRERAEAEWPAGAGGFSHWRRGLQLLTTAAEERLQSEVDARACALVREVFGDPFAPPRVDPAWLDWNHGAVRHIAGRVLATGDFGDLPVLGDALEDAGCRDDGLLRHCREPGLHVPGCWALDAVLGR